MDLIAFVVLLKDGTLSVGECFRSQVFDFARDHDAGICGVFNTRQAADIFVGKHTTRLWTNADTAFSDSVSRHPLSNLDAEKELHIARRQSVIVRPFLKARE